jgi:hypothetical protein
VKYARKFKNFIFVCSVAQIMYHYGCSINDIKEQKNVFQLAFNALLSIDKTIDSTDRLFIYPINSEYNVKRLFIVSPLIFIVFFLLVIISITEFQSTDWH